MFQLNIQNFRSFKNIDFDFSRINILIGPNNSGKSTLLKFFLMLKQSIDEPESPLTVKGKLVDLGQFEDVIYKGSEKKEFEFTLGTEENYKKSIVSGQSNPETQEKIKTLLEDSLPINLNIRFLQNTDKLIYIEKVIYNKNIGKLFYENERVEVGELDNYIALDVVFNENNLKNIKVQKNAFLTHLSTRDLIENANGDALKLFILNRTEAYLKNVVNKMIYINPLNSLPKRVFEKDGESNDLEVIVNWLASENNEELRNERVEKLSKLFQQMGIAEEVKLDIYRNFIEVLIRTEKDGFWINLADVGLGISLLIPMLFQASASEEAGELDILLLEQPEIHIHPKLHENFIETLVGIGEKNTYFIETHSPFIVQKLQVMVKEGQLKPEDVAIYYFEKEGNETKATRYNIEEDGFMDKSLPESFIGNSYNLAMKLLK